MILCGRWPASGSWRCSGDVEACVSRVFGAFRQQRGNLWECRIQTLFVTWRMDSDTTTRVGTEKLGIVQWETHGVSQPVRKYNVAEVMPPGRNSLIMVLVTMFHNLFSVGMKLLCGRREFGSSTP